MEIKDAIGAKEPAARPRGPQRRRFRHRVARGHRGVGAGAATGCSCHGRGPESHDILTLCPEALPTLLIHPKFQATRSGTFSTCTRP